MMQNALKRISDGLDCLADAADTLTGQDRRKLVSLMQGIEDLTDSPRNIEVWLAECAAGEVTVH